MKRIFGSYQTLLPIVYLQLILVSVFPACSQTSASSSIPKYHPRVSDFQLAGDQIIPEVDSSNRLVFSGSSSAVPAESGVDRFTAPPIAVVMEQKIAVRDARTGAELFDGKPLNGFHEFVKRSGTWEPGSWTAYVEGSSFSVRTEIVAISRHPGYIISLLIKNHSKKTSRFDIASFQQPHIAAPKEWNWNAAFKRTAVTPITRQTNDAIVYGNGDGSVAIASNHASIQRFRTLADARAFFENESNKSQEQTKEQGEVSLLSTSLKIEPGGESTAFIIVTSSSQPTEVVEHAADLAGDPSAAISEARSTMQKSLAQWFERLPAVSSSSPSVLKFYHHAAVQLFYDRWRVGKTFLLDPWYPTSGLDSGAMNAYMWDLQYAALAFSLLDPSSMRKLLIALPEAPLTEHYSIEPIKGRGIGPFYGYNAYAYIDSVNQYLSVTGDRSILRERVRGKTVLEWMIALAEWGEQERDPDNNGLLDYGNDENLLELKKTGNGPGYCNEVPSPNGERVYGYRVVADLMKQENPQLYGERILHFRAMAKRVTDALNSVLWLEKEGWYGTRQRDGSVVPVYSIQIFDLLRIPGLVPADRAKRLISHLNEEEFVAPWGIRSMSLKDRLFDYNDHDWAGAISYAGDGPQLSADLFTAGFIPEGWLALNKILWWPDHMAVYPQGIGNDSYTFRYPAAARFGGRITGARANIIAGVAGVETVLRGIFGLTLGEDGSIRFSNNTSSAVKSMGVSFPYDKRTWTADLTREELRVFSDDGFGMRFLRSDGSVRIRIQPSGITLWMRSRSAATSKVSLDLRGIEHLLQVHKLEQLNFRENGALIQPTLQGTSLTLKTRTSPEEDLQLEIAPAGASLSTR